MSSHRALLATTLAVALAACGVALWLARDGSESGGKAAAVVGPGGDPPDLTVSVLAPDLAAPGPAAPGATAGEAAGAEREVVPVSGRGRRASVDVDPTAESPVSLRGLVSDDLGRPIETFRVRTTEILDGVPVFRPGKSVSRIGSSGGEFQLRDLAEGEWTILVDAAGHDAAELEVSIPHAGPPLAFTLPRTASASGVVVDPLGAPVAAAKVQASREVGREWRLIEKGVDTDDDGRFTIEDVAPGSVALKADSDDYAPSAPQELALAPGEAREGLRLVLAHGGRITGEIYREDGQPDPGREILAATRGDDYGAECTSNAQGRFEIAGLDPGTYRVMAVPRGGIFGSRDEKGEADDDPTSLLNDLKVTSAEVRVGETTHVVLGAPPAAPVRLHGRVTSGGEPLARTMVTALVEGSSMLSMMSKLKMVGTDEDGNYEAMLDEPGDYTLVVGSDASHGRTEFHVTVPQVPEHRLDLALPLGRLSGTVYGPGGSPLAGAKVSIAPEGSLSILSAWEGVSDQVTDADGRYAFENLRAKSYTVRAGTKRLAPGRRSSAIAIRSGVVVVEDRPVEGVDLHLSEPGLIVGTVRGSDGRPVAGAAIFVRDANGYLLEPMTMTTSREDGTFRYQRAASGLHTLSARLGQEVSPESLPVRVAMDRAAEVELTLTAGTTLRISAEDEAGATLRASIQVLDEAGRDHAVMLTIPEMVEEADDGFSTSEHRVGPLPPGRYLITATALDGRSATKPVNLSGRDERKVRIQLR